MTLSDIQLAENPANTLENKPHKGGLKQSNFPWWLVALILLIGLTFFLVLSGGNISDAFFFIKEGLSVTILKIGRAHV